jgi:hypothetical protein
MRQQHEGLWWAYQCINRPNAISQEILSGHESSRFIYDLLLSLPTDGLMKGRLLRLRREICLQHAETESISKCTSQGR